MSRYQPGGFGGTMGRPMTPSRAGSIRPPSVGGLAAAPGSRGLGSVRRISTSGRVPGAPEGTPHTDIKVAHRPVTQQGLAMNTQHLGPRRQVADPSYFLAELNNRRKAIEQETTKLKAELQGIQKDDEMFSRLDRQKKKIWGQVKVLEGQLADFNLAMNRVRHNMTVEELKDMYNSAKEKNDLDRKQVDDIYLEADQLDKERQEMERQLKDIQDQAAKRMADLGASAQQEYVKLQEQNKKMLEQSQTTEQELQSLINQKHRMQKRLSDPEFQTHKRGLELRKRKMELEKEKSELIEETSVTLTPAQLREKLKNRLEAVKLNIETAIKSKDMMEAIVEENNVAISNKEAELQEAKTHKMKADKYANLYQRERHIKDYLDNFEQKKANQKQQKEKLQKTIVALLTHISKGLRAKKNLPNQKQFEKIKHEVSFKMQRINNSKSTALKLEKELEKKKSALAKIAVLDKKLPLELKQFKIKIREMKAEMKAFKSKEQLQIEAKQAKAILSQQKISTSKTKEMLKMRVKLLGRDVEAQRRELSTNENTKRLEQMEQRLRQYALSEFNYSEFIMAKQRESDWQSLASQARELTAEINKLNLTQSKQSS